MEPSLPRSILPGDHYSPAVFPFRLLFTLPRLFRRFRAACPLFLPRRTILALFLFPLHENPLPACPFLADHTQWPILPFAFRFLDFLLFQLSFLPLALSGPFIYIAATNCVCAACRLGLVRSSLQPERREAGPAA